MATSKITDIQLTKPISTGTDISDIQLTPNSTQFDRERVASNSTFDRQETDRTNSSNNSNNSNELIGRHSTMNESAVDADLLQTQHRLKESKCDRFKSIFGIALEGDLAGFQIFWLCISTGFIVLKIFGITDVVKRIEWWAIFVIPIFNALLTAFFDFIIRKYRSTKNTVESLRKSRFIVLWTIKVIASIYITSYWVWGPYSFKDRFQNTEDYKSDTGACNGQIITVYISIIMAVFMSEVMITTVLINSEQNLSATRTPTKYRFILLIIRPFVWVYNRTMVMFLCFYGIYGCFYTIFVVGFVCDQLCKSEFCSETQEVGLQMLLVPFTVPNYLLNIGQIFRTWEDIEDEKLLETFVVVFLCQSFYVDILNSIWQFSKRYLMKSFRRNKKIKETSSMRGKSPSPLAAMELQQGLHKEMAPMRINSETQKAGSYSSETKL